MISPGPASRTEGNPNVTRSAVRCRLGDGRELGIPGVAIGVWVDGREVRACHGVTSVENPLPVDPDTLYVLGSVTKPPH